LPVLIAQDARVADLAPLIQYLPVPEVDWTDSGIYLSLHSLNESDRNHLKKALEEPPAAAWYGNRFSSITARMC
jgi:hypothetical protein